MFNLLQIGKKALLASELQLQTTGNNIANVNTTGYSRQRVLQSASNPVSDSFGYYGTGVEVDSVERMRDAYLDTNYRQENSLLGFWDSTSTHLTELETNLQEPSDYGLLNTLSQFWDNWENLSDNPTGVSHRQDLLETADQLVTAFHDAAETIANKRTDLNTAIGATAGEINAIAEQLASINQQIDQARLQGTPANDLEDKFDLLVDQLSEYGNVSVQHRTGDDGTVVYFGSDELVKHDHCRTLVTQSETRNGIETVNLAWSDTRSGIAGLNSGSIAGLTKLRDVTLTAYQTQLDNAAVTLAREVNAIHVNGYGLGNPPSNGRYFFDPSVTGAADIQLSTDIAGNPDAIAASQDGEEGDNRIALLVSKLREGTVIGGNQSIADSLGALYSRVGRDSLNASNSTAAYTDSKTQLSNLREAVKGVSLNEEAANLLQYQQSYQAAAKVVAAADNLLQIVIGLVD